MLLHRWVHSEQAIWGSGTWLGKLSHYPIDGYTSPFLSLCLSLLPVNLRWVALLYHINSAMMLHLITWANAIELQIMAWSLWNCYKKKSWSCFPRHFVTTKTSEHTYRLRRNPRGWRHGSGVNCTCYSRDLGLTPSTHSSRGSNALFWHLVQTYIQSKHPYA